MNEAHVQDGSLDDFGDGTCPNFPESRDVQYIGGWLKIPGVEAMKMPHLKDIFLHTSSEDFFAVEICLGDKVLLKGDRETVRACWNQIVTLVPLPRGNPQSGECVLVDLPDWCPTAREELERRVLEIATQLKKPATRRPR